MSAILQLKKDMRLLNTNIECLEIKNNELKALYIDETIQLKKEISLLELCETENKSIKKEIELLQLQENKNNGLEELELFKKRLEKTHQILIILLWIMKSINEIIKWQPNYLALFKNPNNNKDNLNKKSKYL